MIKNTDDYRIKPGDKVDLSKWKTLYDGPIQKQEAKDATLALSHKLADLQSLMHAESKRSLLIVLQAMDAGGKDSTIRHVFSPLNPQGCKVVSFKSPNGVELAHDFLWRIHQNTPRLGHIGVFNRSHYEDILIVSVKDLVPEERWKKRYKHINDLEQMLIDEGTLVVKFFLHISKDYQKERLERRLRRPDKRWKFEMADLTERALWDDYTHAYEKMFEKCNSEQSPWYVIPAEKRWFRNLLITQVLVETLQKQNMQLPEVKLDLDNIVIP